MVNSRCAHGLQEPFSPQPKAMSRLARNNRRRLETSILIILLVTSAVPPIGLVSTSMFLFARHSKSLVSNSCRAVKKRE